MQRFDTPSISLYALSFALTACGGGSVHAIAPDASTDAGHGSPPPDANADSSDDASCTGGRITFTMLLPTGELSCPGPTGGCNGDWLTITSPSDASINTDLGIGCWTTCAACQQNECPIICGIPSPTSSNPSSTWDGTYWTAGTCGANSSTCANPSCASPGHYLATMCATPLHTEDASLPACESPGTATCTSVGFDWPPATTGMVVTGSIADAG